MPSIPLYTVIVHPDLNITFELSEELFQQAFKEVEAQQKERDAELESLRTARNNQYQLFLMDDLPKEGQPIPEHAIYLGKKDYIIYKSGTERQLLRYPDDWAGTPSKKDLTKIETKLIILDAIVGKLKIETPQSVTLQKYVDTYMKAHTQVHAAYGAYTKSVVIKGPDNQPRDITLKVLDKDVLNKASSLEEHRFTVSKDNDQIILKTNGPGLHTLKLYAANLVSALDVHVQDEQRYPKIEITGKYAKVLDGTKASLVKSIRKKAEEKASTYRIIRNSLLLYLLALGIVIACLAVSIIPISVPLILTLTLAAAITLPIGIGAVISCGACFFESKAYLREADRIEKLPFSEPMSLKCNSSSIQFRRSWEYIRFTGVGGGIPIPIVGLHYTIDELEDDLAIYYREALLNRDKPNDVNKPAVTTNAEVSSKNQSAVRKSTYIGPRSEKPSSGQKPRGSK
jgi:hypothetical protein